jgi:hypothetical protein
MNIALADATIGAWNAKNTYNFWRPVTAIRGAPRLNLDTAPADARIPGIPLRLRRLGGEAELDERINALEALRAAIKATEPELVERFHDGLVAVLRALDLFEDVPDELVAAET